jgi:hypothetical protein
MWYSYYLGNNTCVDALPHVYLKKLRNARQHTASPHGLGMLQAAQVLLRTLQGTPLLAGRSPWQAVCSAHPDAAAPCAPPQAEQSEWWPGAASPPLHTAREQLPCSVVR